LINSEGTVRVTVIGGIREGGRQSMLGMICEIGRFEAPISS